MHAQPATLEQFESVLSHYDSATLALEEWCKLRGLADPADVIAKPLYSAVEHAPHSLRNTLELEANDTFAMRHVELSCHGTVLSVAWNWYVPTRLTTEMNDALRLTNTPFGKVIAPLNFTRQALSKFAGAEENCPQGTISTHRALLSGPEGKPLAYLVECYTNANLTL